MKVPIDRIPPLAAWTEDVSGAERRFVPFAGGSAPQPDQAAVRAMNAAAAREAVEITGEYARITALPLALLVACATGAGMFVLVDGSADYWAPMIAAAIAFSSGASAYVALRQRFIWRHRGYAARTALLTLGRCGTCGFLLRGARRRVQGHTEIVELCQCGECGSAWPFEASERPKRSDTGERADLPEVTGVDAMRARIRLWRALRAQPSDFIRDANNEPRYIAHMDGDHRTGIVALFRDIFDAAAATLMTLVIGACILGCPSSCISFLVTTLTMGAPPPVRFGIEVAAALALALGAMTLARRVFTPRHRMMQSRRLFANGMCACCTMELPPLDASHLTRCTCCTSVWRR